MLRLTRCFLSPGVDKANCERLLEFIKTAEYAKAGEVWKKGGFSTTYKNKLKLNPRMLLCLLSTKNQGVFSLARNLDAFLNENRKTRNYFEEAASLVMLRTMLSTLRKAKKIDMTCSRGTKTYSILCEMRDFFKWLIENNHPVGKHAWTTMIQAASTAKSPSIVKLYIHEMQNAGYGIDVLIATMAISSFKATKNTKPAILKQLRGDTHAMWRHINKPDSTSTPDIRCYSAMMSVLTSFGDTVHAKQLHNQMLSKGLQPRVETYTSLIGIAATEADLHGIIREMSERDIRMDGHCFSAILTALRRVSRDSIATMDKAESLFETMVAEGVKMDAYTCNAMLLGYKDTRNARKCARFFTRMVNTLKVNPAHSSVNIVLEACSLTPSEESLKIADWAWAYATVNKLYTHHSYGFLMKLNNELSRPDATHKLFSELKRTGLPLSMQHYNLVIDAYKMQNCHDAAEQIAKLPKYQELLSSMQGQRPGPKGDPTKLYIKEEQQQTAVEVGKKIEFDKTEQGGETTGPPGLPKDSLARGLARLADKIEQKPKLKETPKTRFAIDDILGL